MAIFSYNCEDHGIFNKFLSKGTKSEKCPKCGKDSERQVRAGGVRVTEKIDNGLMSRSIERLVNVEELNSERSDIHKKNLEEKKLV